MSPFMKSLQEGDLVLVDAVPNFLGHVKAKKWWLSSEPRVLIKESNEWYPLSIIRRPTQFDIDRIMKRNATRMVLE